MAPGFTLRSRRNAGFSLLEVLIAVIVLSIGLLGLAGLQLSASKNNQEAFYRTQATLLANDIVDRMRANREAALNGDYDIALGADANGNTLAAQDLAAWKNRLEATLPDGDGSTSLGAGDTMTIIVQWTERAIAEEDTGTIQFRTETQL